MKVLIAGGSGFLGRALAKSLQADGTEVLILTRRTPSQPNELQWDGRSTNGWGEKIGEVEAVVNATGFSLEHWPWTPSQKKRFLESRTLPGKALVAAIQESPRRPRVFLQLSGINHYGLQGGPADEATAPAEDYLAELTVQWEAATSGVEELGLRRVVARTAVVLDAHHGTLPLMAMPVRFFLGGPLGNGRQFVPWIHLADQIGALRFLLEREDLRGPFNLIAPDPATNERFMQEIARALQRPSGFRTPAFFLQVLLGEMSVLILEGRQAQPRRLLEAGYQFQYPTLEGALRQLFS